MRVHGHDAGRTAGRTASAGRTAGAGRPEGTASAASAARGAGPRTGHGAERTEASAASAASAGPRQRARRAAAGAAPRRRRARGRVRGLRPRAPGVLQRVSLRPGLPLRGGRRTDDARGGPGVCGPAAAGAAPPQAGPDGGCGHKRRARGAVCTSLSRWDRWTGCAAGLLLQSASEMSMCSRVERRGDRGRNV